MLLVTLPTDDDFSRQEELIQKNSSEARLREQIRKAECKIKDLEELLIRKEQHVTDYQGQLAMVRVSQERKLQEQIREYKSRLFEKETQVKQVQTQLGELQEQFMILKEHKDREICDLQKELSQKKSSEARLLEQIRKAECKIKDLEELLLRKEQHVTDYQGQLAMIRVSQERKLQEHIRDYNSRLLEKETQVKRVQTQLRELQEQFIILKEHKDREICDLHNELQEILKLKSDLKEAKHTLSKYELQLKTRDWIVSRDEVELTGKRLGEGSFGIVLEGRYCDCPVAVKKLKESIFTPQVLNLFEREMDIASRCRHPCLLLFIGASEDEHSRPLFIVTELMDLSLRALLGQRQLSETEVSVISLDVARALDYLHQRKPTPIIHRDVSSANVLLWKQNDQWRGKLSDYGTARFAAEIMTNNPGALIYAAPEAGSSDYQTEVGLSVLVNAHT